MKEQLFALTYNTRRNLKLKSIKMKEAIT